MKRHITRLSQLLLDLLFLTLALALAFMLRFDWKPPTVFVGRFLLIAPYVVATEYAILLLCGVHRFSWRYVGLREVTRVLGAATLWTAVLVASRIALGELQTSYPYLRHGVVPYGVVAANFFLSFAAVAGIRVVRRILGERADVGRRAPIADEPVVPTMLVGAGQAGFMVAREIASRRDLRVKPVGFIDDDSTKVGTFIHGIRVVGTTDSLAALCTEHGAREVLITMASVPGQAIRRIRQLATEAGLPVKIIPGLYEIVGGKVNLSRIRDVAIEDLLRREPIELDEASIRHYIKDRVVLVSGAGGSIGSEICRQIAAIRPRRLLLVERSENSLFEIHREIKRSYPELDLVPCIADVTDAERIEEIFSRHRPSAVFHAAAHKHVPMMEWNPGEAVKNNVFGSKTLANAAHAHAADAFVMVSTDKAVNPTSVMGATKRVAELYVQALAERSQTRFVTVRFGNVLGSAGSVVPIFQQQIARGGPVTVTHPEMRRYFMTIPEACQLVLQAGCIGSSGDIMVLDMGEPVRIVDLARDLISLSGLREGEDVVIEFSGVRPGEKLFEELATDAEHAEKTKHPKIFVGRTQKPDVDRVRGAVDGLRALCASTDPAAIRAALSELVPEMIAPASESSEREGAAGKLLAVGGSPA
ncbi:MAG: polysaccharide biosynthesis protein [Deltaproteobacteria bacterium]|nr:polysaccharide biosynthesis protein [Deltaproteobacteria bacterium]